MEIFDKRFVHFMWDDELEGKKCFVEDYIGDLCTLVEKGNKCDLHEVRKSDDVDAPFQANDDLNFTFAYYDPNYPIKKAFNEGKKVQYQLVGGVDWGDIDSDEALKWRIAEGRTFRIKPEEEKWISYLAMPNGNGCYLTACREDSWKMAQEVYGAKTKLFIGSKSEVEAWYKARHKFTDVIKAWEDGKTIQVRDDVNKWVDCAVTPFWFCDLEYRIKPDCPCEDGIDSKACVGCEHSEDGKREYKPYVTVDEFIQDFQERFPTAVPRPAYTKPLIWVRLKVDKRERLIVTYGDNFVEIGNKTKTVTLQHLFEQYEFLDESPVGMEYAK